MERTLSIILGNPISIVFVGMILVGMLVLVVSVLFKNGGKDNTDQVLEKKKDVVSLEEGEELKNDIFQVYKDVEIAKMKFKFGVLEEKLGKDLYLEVEKEMKEFRENRWKQVSTDITLEEIRVLSKYVKDNVEKIEVFLYVSQFDYVIDKEKRVVRGTDDGRYQVEYKMIVDKELKTGKYVISKMECVGKWIKK